MNGIVFDIGECSIHDGPGLRITVFLKGCPLRCRWCHSPEGQLPEPETLHFKGGERLAGESWSADKLAGYLRDKSDLLDGVTFSGGEPLFQADFLDEVLRELGGKLHVIVDTSGVGDGNALLKLAPRVSYFHWGLKLLDEAAAQYWVGSSPSPMLANLRRLDRESTTPYRFRIPLIPGVTDTAANLDALAGLTCELHHLAAVEFLPYNPAAGGKYAACGRGFAPGFDETRPSSLDIEAFQKKIAVPAIKLN
ncbi:MAG: radical SAM protein [Victivallaceae bacterium]|nr:radical SAM protein [Victivallaceae bacterium]